MPKSYRLKTGVCIGGNTSPLPLCLIRYFADAKLSRETGKVHVHRRLYDLWTSGEKSEQLGLRGNELRQPQFMSHKEDVITEEDDVLIVGVTDVGGTLQALASVAK